VSTPPGQAARATALRAARARDSHDKRRRALDAVQALEAAGAAVTAAAVAATAGVSTWLVYADGVREHLGAEIEGPDRAELIARVANLKAAARQLLAERDARAAEAALAQRRVRELEDDLTAARESLRRVIRDANR